MSLLPVPFLTAVVLAGLSGVPGLFLPPASALGQRLATILSLAASALGLWAAGNAFFHPLPAPLGGEWFFWDALSCFFLAGVFLLSALGSLYGHAYWKAEEHPDNGRKVRLFYGLITAGMALVTVSRHAFVFLAAWELMALSAFFLITGEDEKAEVREAGWTYLVATHAGTLALFGFFAAYGVLQGSFLLHPIAPGSAGESLLFLLALAGFGLKAGVFPLHVWLPSAHANAPSHVSALLSGVMLKIGVYGFLRVLSLFPHPPAWWGVTVLAVGAVSAVLGVAFALGQHDLKRLLAYHSIENIGIIFLGIGAALLGRAYAHPEWTALGLAGALLHVWNHGLFKASLFYSAGSVIHATGTRSIDALGGLGKKMPWTSLFFLLGAVAICGLPPLNGFISEFLVYLGLFRGLSHPSAWGPAAAAILALALTGALAVACFTKVFGAVFLGEARGEAAKRAGEAPGVMLLPGAVLTLLCAWIGFFPGTVTRFLTAAAGVWCGESSEAPAQPIGEIPWGLFALGGILLGVLFFLLLFALRRAVVPENEGGRVPTWDCGYLRPTASMQYTASSFAATLVQLFGWILKPHRSGRGPEGYFPQGAECATHVPETVLERVVTPWFRGAGGLLIRVKALQGGQLRAYVAYLLLTLLILVLWR